MGKEIVSGSLSSEQAGDSDSREMVRKGIRRLLRDPLSVFGMAILVVVVLTAIFGPSLARYEPVGMFPKERFLAPDNQYWMGTDHLGRDVFTRVVYGTRISLLVAIGVSSLSAIIGLILGGVAGFIGGWVDEGLMRITDIFQSFPWLIFAMAIALVIGANLVNTMLSLAFIWWPGYARLVRGQILVTKSKEFVLASHALGASNLRIFLRHLLPNSMGPLIVLLTIGAGRVILATSTLSFIGLGAQRPTPEWGVMVADGRTLLFDAWWICTFPGIAILLTAVGFNLLGDGLRDLLDPMAKVKG